MGTEVGISLRATLTVERRLGAEALSFLLAAEARHTGPMDSFFAVVRRTLDVAESPNELWRQYRACPSWVPADSKTSMRCGYNARNG